MPVRTPPRKRPGSARAAGAAALAAALGAASGGAAEGEAPALSLSGYGTLGVVRSSDARSDYLVDIFRPTGPGFSDRWSAEADTRLGLQATVVLAPRLSAVLQLLAQQRYDDSYTPVVEWANLQYRITPELAIRAGRIVLPVFMSTDSRKVGYASPWVRTPVEVYSLVPITNNDGADASWRLPLGEATNTLQASYGSSEPKYVDAMGTGTAQARRILVVANTVERGFATARASYGRASLSIDRLDPLFDAFRQFGPAGAAIAERYELRDKRVTFAGIGGAYDPGAWFAMAEWARFKTRSVVGARSAWYASGGYRLGEWTPYATYARSKNEGETESAALPLAGLPQPLAGLAVGLNATLAALVSDVPAQRTWSLGARWDFAKKAALKLQYDRVRRAPDSTGTFGNTQPGFERGGSANLISFAVDFVF